MILLVCFSLGNSANIRKLCEGNCEGFEGGDTLPAAPASDNYSHATAIAMAIAKASNNKASAAAAA